MVISFFDDESDVGILSVGPRIKPIDFRPVRTGRRIAGIVPDCQRPTASNSTTVNVVRRKDLDRYGLQAGTRPRQRGVAHARVDLQIGDLKRDRCTMSARILLFGPAQSVEEGRELRDREAVRGRDRHGRRGCE